MSTILAGFCRFLRPALLVMALAGAPPAVAAPDHQPSDAGGILALLPDASVTRHTIELSGRQIAYQATAATLPLRDGSGKTTAEIFYVAYAAQPEARDRPLTFVFNGGPGAASAYLHIGALGPRIVRSGADGSVPPPPARLVDNPDSWLDFTDLVFVDPVGTGYSRAAEAKDEKDFWSVDADRDAMAAFIRLYLAQTGRATSPVFLVGESYGGFRAALLAKALPLDSGVGPSGIVLISPALEFSLLFGHESGQILPSALALPAMAAVNFVRQGVGDRAQLGERLRSVEDFALGDYLADLAAGPVAARDRASARVAEITGLPLDAVRRQFGDIPLSFFAKTFDAAGGKVLSRYDGTIGGPDLDPSGTFLRGPDAVLDRTVPVWTSAFVDYVRGDLGYRTDITYRLLNRDVSRDWSYGIGRTDQGYADAMEDLQSARILNPALQILIAQGYTDLVTPYLTSRYLVGQLAPLQGAAPIRQEDYLGGHMMYLRADSRHALKEDARSLYRRAASAGDAP